MAPGNLSWHQKWGSLVTLESSVGIESSCGTPSRCRENWLLCVENDMLFGGREEDVTAQCETTNVTHR